MDPHIQKMRTFLTERGIPSRLDTLAEPGFLPGLSIVAGELVIDPATLAWPGDILHEAAHIALTPAPSRASLGGKLDVSPADEMAALAWSYAAALAAGVDPSVVFHEGGYRKGGAQLVEQFSSGLPPGGPGVPMLQWYGMTKTFPVMEHWLRPQEQS